MIRFELEIDTKEVMKEEDKDELTDKIVSLASDYLNKKYPNMVADISAMESEVE